MPSWFMKRKVTIYLTEEEDEAIAQLRERYKIKTNSEAIRKAIRMAVKPKQSDYSDKRKENKE